MTANYEIYQGQYISKGKAESLRKRGAYQPVASGLSASAPERIERRPLVRRVPREETRSPSFEIVFTVYARRPCDWDGWSVKQLQDMVVASGILLSDDWSFLSGRVYSKKVHTEEEEGTEITITAL